MLWQCSSLQLVHVSAGPTEPAEAGESGKRYNISETAKEVRSGVELVARYDSDRKVFAGTVRNTTNAKVSQVRVEIHLSNGVELGPTPRVDLAAGEMKSLELNARGQSFTWFSIHVELGSGDHG